MKKLLYFLVCIALFGSIYAGYFSAEGQEIPDNKESHLIKEYLESSLAGDWYNALSLLSGEALINAQHNLGRNTSFEHNTKLNSYETLSSTTAGDYTIADIKTKTVTFAEDETIYDLKFYRFYIYNGAIFKIEPIPPTYKAMAQGEEADVVAVVTNYLSFVEAGKHRDALKLLIGRAREAAVKTVGLTTELDVKFTELFIKVEGCGEDTAYVEATYKANEVPIRAFFILHNTNEKWLIERILIAES